jgi:hypothetical protein
MDVQTISIMVAAAGVFLAAINQIVSRRREEQQRETQLFMQLYNRWNTKAMAQTYGRLRYFYEFGTRQQWETLINKKMGEKWQGTLQENQQNIDIYSDFQSMTEFFEGIGVLVKRHLIDVDLVEDLLANRIIWWWNTQGDLFLEARKVLGDPKLYNDTEYLYNSMIQRQQATLSI